MKPAKNSGVPSITRLLRSKKIAALYALRYFLFLLSFLDPDRDVGHKQRQNYRVIEYFIYIKEYNKMMCSKTDGF